MILSQRF